MVDQGNGPRGGKSWSANVSYERLQGESKDGFGLSEAEDPCVTARGKGFTGRRHERGKKGKYEEKKNN